MIWTRGAPLQFFVRFEERMGLWAWDDVRDIRIDALRERAVVDAAILRDLAALSLLLSLLLKRLFSCAFRLRRS